MTEGRRIHFVALWMTTPSTYVFSPLRSPLRSRLPVKSGVSAWLCITFGGRAGDRRFIFPVLRPSRVDLPRDPEKIELQARLDNLKLSNKAIADREETRIAATQALLRDENRKGLREAGYILRSQTPWFVMLPYKMLCWLLGEIWAVSCLREGVQESDGVLIDSGLLRVDGGVFSFFLCAFASLCMRTLGAVAVVALERRLPGFANGRIWPTVNALYINNLPRS